MALVRGGRASYVSRKKGETVSLQTYPLGNPGHETRPVRVMIIEEHEKVRRELAARLGSEPALELVGTISYGEAAVAVVERRQPDVILLGLGISGQPGLETCRKINVLVPEARIMVLTSCEDEGEKREAYRAGASRYLLKELPVRELIEAIERG